MAENILICLEALLQEVPMWIADLDSILQQSKAKQTELLIERQPVVTSSEERSTSKHSRSSSLRSRRSQQRVAKQTAEEQTQGVAPLLRPQLPHLTDSDALRLSQRKRKTASVLSDHYSSPTKYRSRGMVVVYYDGDTQKRFEALVRAISVRRNAIRKEGMGPKGNTWSWVGSSSSGTSSNGEKDIDAELSRIAYDSPVRKERLADGKGDGSKMLDKIGVHLEKAQMLCERAAHQVLRDGDCAFELNQAKEHFAGAVGVAEQGLLKVKKTTAIPDGDAGERKDEAPLKVRAKDEKRGQDPAIVVTSTAFETPPPLPVEIRLESESDLEVDDSEGEADFAVDTTQLGRYQMRSTGLMAH
ncbi:hypothetical protein BAUCODRAFT_308930 [Baudoinia panamericana UAMH 10762]|uniref:Uncharacterized protein n=1 Tax=Baudoinia panamericana (strain UAMH 10762) TaxID=717646 RepID=M2LD41_BAUPA|nr:uncharacterized protein BAUCODRAFT_308930 [Baudoinia panamericana UAMH 10762]EMC91872.1 hypothetical protein BAUCODRAFT_308930 [Baudoinia panamericana UAMH 10762]